MNRVLFLLAFLAGLGAVIWIGSGFYAGANTLALAMTGLIGIVYLIGWLELVQFRRATLNLRDALLNIPKPLESLSGWLARIHPTLQSAVQLRIDGERNALPGPTLTPYLVGLLVMLGMLGTFLGMVVTLNGAVSAIEGTNELEAIRAGLAAPIKGLGLAFGTSVAGVAASALLGLLSTLSRHERAQVSQLLDQKVASELRSFSLTHHRQETYQALQRQAQALPELVDRLQTMATHIKQMGQQLNERLLSNQDQFHGAARSVYLELAQSVEKSLKDSLAESGRLAGESIKPIVADAMAAIGQQAQQIQTTLRDTTQSQLQGLADTFASRSAEVVAQWREVGQQHQQVQRSLSEDLRQSLEGWLAHAQEAHQALLTAAHGQLEQLSQSFGGKVDSLTANWRETLASQSLTNAQLTRDLTQALAAFNAQFNQTSESLLQAFHQSTAELRSQQAAGDQARLTQWHDALGAISAELKQAWQQAAEQAQNQQQALCTLLERSAQAINEGAQAVSSRTLGEIARLLQTSEALVQARVASEQNWVEQSANRLEQLTAAMRAELSQLRDEEAARGQAAVQHLEGLQAALAEHLATLGNALEAPMTRLIETASEAPRAAAELVAQLRAEISNSLARDNQLLDERGRIMQGLEELLATLNQSSSAQRAAIDALVEASSSMLAATGREFKAEVGTEAAKLSEIAAQVTGSAVEVATLGETFGFAVQRFSESNEKLVDNLNQVQAALAKSSTRSDEQLAYYVAQAREIIDLSLSSQKEIFDELRQLKTPKALASAG